MILTNLKIVLILMIMTFSLNSSNINALTEKVDYNDQDIIMIKSVDIQSNDFIEYNVTITEYNSSLTLIVDNFQSGRIWGLFFEPRANYFREKARIPDPRIFCGFHVLIGEQFFLNVDYYGVAHLNDLQGEYVISIFNLDSSKAELAFDLLALQGNIGEPGIIQAPPSIDILNLTSTLVLFGALTGILYYVINKIDNKFFKN